MVVLSTIMTALATATPTLSGREVTPLPITVTERGAAPIITTLPPQTTPFRPLVHCDLSVYCPFMSDELYYTKAKLNQHPLSGQKCQAFLTTTALGTTSGIDHAYACLPSGYEQLVGEDAMELGGWAERDDSDPRIMVTYPGTECAVGWTSACLATVSHAAATVTQQWCCPRGGWTCQMSTDDLEPRSSGGFDRLCKSIMTEPTDIFMSFDPPTRVAGLVSPQWTWHRGVTAEEARYGATVFHNALPIAPATASASTVDDFIITIVTNHVHETPVPENPAHQSINLTTGDVAGIAAGGTAFFLILLAAAIFAFCRRRKRQVEKFNNNDKKPLGIDVPLMTAVKDDEGGLSTGSTHNGPFLKAELDAAPAMVVTPVIEHGQRGRAVVSEMPGVNYSTDAMIKQNDPNSPQINHHGSPNGQIQHPSPATCPRPSHSIFEMEG